MSYAPTNVPDSVDMRSALWPAEDVGQLVAAAASAVVTALEYHCNRIGEQPTNLSTMFVHYNARLAAGQENANAGTTLEAAMKAVQAYGACRDATWPIDTSKLAVKPPPHAYEEARKFAAIDYSSPADMFEALAMKYPIAFVASLPRRCMAEAGKTGILPPPTAEEIQRQSYMHHAMVLVGYDKANGTVLARNCWGKSWGVEGHCNIAVDTMKIIAPANNRLLIITAKSVAAVTEGPSADAPPAPPQRLADMAAKLREEIRGDVQKEIAEASKRIRDMMPRTPAAQPQPEAPADAAPAAPPQRLADMATKMRDDIRSDVEKEIADATKRIRDRMQPAPANPPAQAPPQQQVGAQATCPACSGGGKCTRCYGAGCHDCSYGSCPRCGGKGMV
jgi:BMFP domain-containing protein YqiC